VQPPVPPVYDASWPKRIKTFPTNSAIENVGI
jgi:hypothetical protein